jgi:hypothetical protein
MWFGGAKMVTSVGYCGIVSQKHSESNSFGKAWVYINTSETPCQVHNAFTDRFLASQSITNEFEDMSNRSLALHIKIL